MVLGYMYVLKQIAEVENKGNMSFNEISGHLKMSTQQLRGLLEIMEEWDILKKLRTTVPSYPLPVPAPAKTVDVAGF